LRGKNASAVAEASQHAADSVEPLSDYFASAEYRKHLAAVYTERALAAALK
jgi:CO/xanthine dehydrogenase FAD-binding subunit